MLYGVTWYRCLWKRHSWREEHPWEGELAEHQIRGWRALSAAELQGKGSRKGMCFCHRHQRGAAIHAMRVCVCVCVCVCAWVIFAAQLLQCFEVYLNTCIVCMVQWTTPNQEPPIEEIPIRLLPKIPGRWLILASTLSSPSDYSALRIHGTCQNDLRFARNYIIMCWTST